MRALTEAIISLFDLAEAEGRLLQRRLLQTLVVALLMLMAALMATGAAILFMAALYQFLITFWQPFLTLIVVGSACLLLAGVLLWSARHVHARNRNKPV